MAVSQRAIWDILHEWADKGAVPLIGTFADSLDGRGGLFALTPRGVEVIDRLSGTGMTTDGNQLWRALRTPIDSGMWLTESISFVSPALLEGLRRGAGVNGFRLIEALAVQRLAQGLAPYRGAETLPDDDREIGVEVPEAMSFVAGSTAAIECRLHNTTGVAISSLGANPIRLGYMWDPPAEGEGRTSLPWIVQSGESVELKLLVNVPTEAGHYHLKIAAVQEHIAWCSGGFEGDVEVIYDLDRTPSY